MNGTTIPETPVTPPSRWTTLSEGGRHWDLAFIGILGYLVVEYTRLPADHPFLIPFRLGKVVVGLALVGLIFSPGSAQGRSPQLRRVDLAVAFMLFAGLISSLFARYQTSTWNAFGVAVQYTIIYFLLGRIVTSPWRLRIFIFLFFLLNFKLAQFSIRDYAQIASSYGQMAASRGVGAGTAGFFANGDDYGVAMCVVWPLAMGLLFTKPQGKLMRLLLLGFCATCLASILLGDSRGAAVGAAAVVLVLLARKPKKLMTGVLVAIFLLGFLYILPGANQKRLQSTLNWRHDPDAMDRIYLWEAGLRMFRDHPILGVGLGNNFRYIRVADYYVPGAPKIPFVQHSIYIQALTDLGLFGTIPFVLLLWFLFRLNAQTRRQLLARDPNCAQSWEFCLSLGLDLALVGFLVSGAFITVLYYPHLWVLGGICVGLHKVSLQNKPGTQPAIWEVERGELAPASMEKY